MINLWLVLFYIALIIYIGVIITNMYLKSMACIVVVLVSFLCSQVAVYTQSSNQTLYTFNSDTCCWRKLANEGKYIEAAHLIVDFIHAHPENKNRHALYWHAGQMFAMANDDKKSVLYFKKTYNIFYAWFGDEDGRQWYYYARGTVAFIQKDFKKLDAIIQHWQKKWTSNVNLQQLQNLSANRHLPYKDAYK